MVRCDQQQGNNCPFHPGEIRIAWHYSAGSRGTGCHRPFPRPCQRRIERYIRAKKKLIALLNEHKQAIIHRAVTRGLDPNIRLKPSGVPWLRQVPSHWSSILIKRLLSRIDYGTSEVSKTDGSIRILTMGNIQKGEVTVPSSGGLDEVSDDLLLEHNDLLFTRTNGNPDLVGKVGIFRGQRSDKVSFASYLVRLRVKQPNDPQWLHMLLNSASFWPFARSHALVNLQTNLNSTRYCQFSVPVPPLPEQMQIVQGVDKESRSLSSAIMGAEREIALVREYRTRLVADVVTPGVQFNLRWKFNIPIGRYQLPIPSRASETARLHSGSQYVAPFPA